MIGMFRCRNSVRGTETMLDSGSILLLRVTDPDGPTARRLKDRGERNPGREDNGCSLGSGAQAGR